MDERMLMIDPLLAYLDPGTGATLVQLALAGTAGVAAAAKLRMNRLKQRASKDETTEEAPPATEDTPEPVAPHE
jgi:hypothetical protein